MRRPDFGTQGRPVKLKANHFRVTCSLKEVTPIPAHFGCDLNFHTLARKGLSGSDSYHRHTFMAIT